MNKTEVYMFFWLLNLSSFSDLSCSCSRHQSRRTSLCLACVTWRKANTATASTCRTTRRGEASSCAPWSPARLQITPTSGPETDSSRYDWSQGVRNVLGAACIGLGVTGTSLSFPWQLIRFMEKRPAEEAFKGRRSLCK